MFTNRISQIKIQSLLQKNSLALLKENRNEEVKLEEAYIGKVQ